MHIDGTYLQFYAIYFQLCMHMCLSKRNLQVSTSLNILNSEKGFLFKNWKNLSFSYTIMNEIPHK